DFHVTGVQTCALPIASGAPLVPERLRAAEGLLEAVVRALELGALRAPPPDPLLEPAQPLAQLRRLALELPRLAPEPLDHLLRARSEERRVGEGRSYGW